MIRLGFQEYLCSWLHIDLLDCEDLSLVNLCTDYNRDLLRHRRKRVGCKLCFDRFIYYWSQYFVIWFNQPFDVFCLRQVFVHLSVWQLCSLPLQWASLQWVVLGEKMHHLYKVRQYHLHAIIIRLLLSLPNRLLISFFAKILSVCQENVAGGFRLPIFWCLLPWLRRTEQRNLPKRYVNFL